LKVKEEDLGGGKQEAFTLEGESGEETVSDALAKSVCISELPEGLSPTPGA
jgi:hypothetical protein